MCYLNQKILKDSNHKISNCMKGIFSFNINPSSYQSIKNFNLFVFSKLRKKLFYIIPINWVR